MSNGLRISPLSVQKQNSSVVDGHFSVAETFPIIRSVLMVKIGLRRYCYLYIVICRMFQSSILGINGSPSEYQSQNIQDMLRE